MAWMPRNRPHGTWHRHGVDRICRLTRRSRAVRDAKSADFVHFGATSQDVTDTAMVLVVRRARAILAADHARLESALRQLSDAHAHTVMLGRTLLQPRRR